jgi:DNA uptake protein ComE-like DNA-binding protein
MKSKERNYMCSNYITATITAVALLLSVSLTFADENAAGSSQETTTKAKTSSKSASSSKSKVGVKRKATPKIKTVDINNATSAELKKLPGVSDADAAKIIAGRPYATKAHLLTHKIIAGVTYENIKKHVIAKQPNKDASKNAAIYSKKK